MFSAQAEDMFTWAIVPDVQMETSDSRFADRLTWLVENRDPLNLNLMLLCGDLMNFNVEAQYVFDKVMMPFANVRLVFCGHVGTHRYRTDKGANGNTIHQFLQCYTVFKCLLLDNSPQPAIMRSQLNFFESTQG